MVYLWKDKSRISHEQPWSSLGSSWPWKNILPAIGIFSGKIWWWFVHRITGVKFHFCLEFQRPEEINTNSFIINEAMCPLCGEINDILYRRSAHIDFIPCISPLQGRYLIFHITSIVEYNGVIENLGAVAVEMNIPHWTYQIYSHSKASM